MSEREARERVGKAIRDARTMDEYHSGDIDMGHLTTAALAAHNAWLWHRADDPEVLEAVATALASGMGAETSWFLWANDAKKATTVLLTALIGPRPSGEETADV